MLLQVMLECNPPRRLYFCGHSDWAAPLPFRTQGVQNAKSCNAWDNVLSSEELPVPNSNNVPTEKAKAGEWQPEGVMQGCLASRGQVGMEC